MNKKEKKLLNRVEMIFRRFRASMKERLITVTQFIVDLWQEHCRVSTNLDYIHFFANKR